MNTMIKIMGVILVIGTIFGCQENEGQEFIGESTLFFTNDATLQQQDSMAHSFFMLPEGQNRDTIEIRIEAGGYPAVQDRPFVLKQTNEGESDAAVAGKHFIAFDDPEMQKELIFPANTVEKKLKLILLNAPDLAEGKVRLALAFGENEYFKAGVNEQKNFVVTTTAKPEPPVSWPDIWVYHFGEWGAEKMKFIIKSTGFSDFDATGIDDGYRRYLLAKASQALLEYNSNPENNPPLKEADGTIVEFK